MFVSQLSGHGKGRSFVVASDHISTVKAEVATVKLTNKAVYDRPVVRVINSKNARNELC